MSTHGVSRDPFGELSGGGGLPAGLRQRFPDRVLVMTTDGCFGRCPHCTRKFILGKSPVVDSPARLAACVEYVKRHRKVRDVLLSGGDVLTLSDAEVGRLVDAFASLDQVEVVRICTRAPVAIAPAMNDGMWENAATKDNIAALEQRGVKIIAPGYGDLACGSSGLGRMAEPSEIFAALG